MVEKLKAERHFLHNPKEQQQHLWAKQKSKGKAKQKIQ